MSSRDADTDGSEAVQEAAEHADRAVQERQEMRRTANLAGTADDAGETEELARESEAHKQAADEQEDASSDRAPEHD